MQLPREVPVMVLRNTTLFPQAPLPLYIFEPRYRQMLADVLETHRTFCVAMRKPGSRSETPVTIAGLGLIRVAVTHPDGTTHLILQGLARVALRETVRLRPYRVARIELLQTPPCDNVKTDALLAKVRELVQEGCDLGLPLVFPLLPPNETLKPPPDFVEQMVGLLNSINDPEEAADLVSCAVLPDARQRQAMLETLEVETRLRRLIQFLLGEIRRYRQAHHD
jgi:ATP-dependent Lon protease